VGFFKAVGLGGLTFKSIVWRFGVMVVEALGPFEREEGFEIEGFEAVGFEEVGFLSIFESYL